MTPLAGSNEFQPHPEGDGDEPSRCSDLTGSGDRWKGMVVNVGLCNEMRTVCEHGRWRTRDVRAIQLLELLFLPKRKLAFENLDPGCWRGSCELVVENFQDVILHSYNLLNCAPSVPATVRCGAGVWRGVLRFVASNSASGRVCWGTCARAGSILSAHPCRHRQIIPSDDSAT